MKKDLYIAYGSEYLDWRLGSGHPTNPERALISTQLIEEMLGKDSITYLTPNASNSDRELLTEVHSPEYVSDVLDTGVSGEWSGQSPKLGATALSMFAGTVRLVEALENGTAKIAFNPQGAKHHAMYDHSSGFCVFNDMAWAAKHFASQGKSVMYIDWDAHHGDGVEKLLLDTSVTTCSIHERGIFPGTGNVSMPEKNAYNWALPSKSSTGAFLSAMLDIHELAMSIKPDLVILATGADAHKSDPLSSLQFEVEDYIDASKIVSNIANTFSEGRILIGGAGGYQPHTFTPLVWASVVSEVYKNSSLSRKRHADNVTPAP